MAQTKELTNAKGTPGTPAAFRQLATRMAGDLLTEWVGEERANEAVGRIGAALSSSAASAKKPEDFYSCTPASIANCVALAALTSIMPGSGPAALAYLIPRSPRRGEQKQLGFSFSHRGLNALAGRSGQIMIAVPISVTDHISVTSDGEIIVDNIDFDNPPMEFGELRGVMVVVKRIESGAVVHRGWVAKKLIEKRRAASDAYQYAIKNKWAQDSDPWHVWPIEMAMKTGMHYAIARGWCVIDDSSAVRALSGDVEYQRDDRPALPPQTLSQLSDQMALPHDTTPEPESEPVADGDGPGQTIADDGEIIDPPAICDICGGNSGEHSDTCPNGEEQPNADGIVADYRQQIADVPTAIGAKAIADAAQTDKRLDLDTRIKLRDEAKARQQELAK